MAARAEARAAARPGAAGWRRLLRAGRREGFFVAGVVLVAPFVVCAVAPSLVSPADPLRLDVAHQFLPPGAGHPFGTDDLGRDLLARVVNGARYSFGLAVAITMLGAVLGTAVGLVSGFAGGWVDEVCMRVVDVALALPAFILAMAIAASLGRGMSSLVVALALVWWPSYARMVRGMVLSIKERQHVEAARALGAGPAYIVRRHVVPFLAGELNVRVTQDMGYALVAVASLSFIGLGAQPPTPEWGVLLGAARTYITTAWWYPLFPGLAITLLTLGLAVLGDGIAALVSERPDGE